MFGTQNGRVLRARHCAQLTGVAYPLLWVGVIACLPAIVWGAPPKNTGGNLQRTPSARETGRESSGKAAATPTTLLREGTELTEEFGSFSLADNRIVFTATASNRRFTTLENLCLERVARNLSDNPTATNWVVSGTVSEYRNGNYLLLRRASVVSRHSAEGPPSPAGGGDGKAAPPAQGPSKGDSVPSRSARLP